MWTDCASKNPKNDAGSKIGTEDELSCRSARFSFTLEACEVERESYHHAYSVATTINEEMISEECTEPSRIQK